MLMARLLLCTRAHEQESSSMASSTILIVEENFHSLVHQWMGGFF